MVGLGVIMTEKLCSTCGKPVGWANQKWNICGDCKGEKIRKTLQAKKNAMSDEDLAREDALAKLRGQLGAARKIINGRIQGDIEVALKFVNEYEQKVIQLAGQVVYYEQQTRPKHGFVYLLQSPTSAYKIGRTKDPQSRMKTFGIQLPFEVEYACLIETPDMYDLESRLHSRFAKKRINGEWFNLTNDDVEYIKSLACT